MVMSHMTSSLGLASPPRGPPPPPGLPNPPPGLPTLPKSLSEFIGSDKLSKIQRHSNNITGDAVDGTQAIVNGKYSSDSEDERHDDMNLEKEIMVNFPPRASSNSLNTALLHLKKEMIDLRHRDVSLLYQLWQLNESIQDYKAMMSERYSFSETNSECSYSFEQDLDTISSDKEDDEDNVSYCSTDTLENHNDSGFYTPKTMSLSGGSIYETGNTLGGTDNANISPVVTSSVSFVKPEEVAGYKAQSSQMYVNSKWSPGSMIKKPVTSPRVSISGNEARKPVPSPRKSVDVSAKLGGGDQEVSKYITNQKVETDKNVSEICVSGVENVVTAARRPKISPRTASPTAITASQGGTRVNVYKSKQQIPLTGPVIEVTVCRETGQPPQGSNRPHSVGIQRGNRTFITLGGPRASHHMLKTPVLPGTSNKEGEKTGINSVPLVVKPQPGPKPSIGPKPMVPKKPAQLSARKPQIPTKPASIVRMMKQTKC